MGKNHLISRRIRIETLEEMTEIERLKKWIEELEQGLVQTQLNINIPDFKTMKIRDVLCLF